jgi:hypothetical protein
VSLVTALIFYEAAHIFISIRANNPQLRSGRDVWEKYLKDSYKKKLSGIPGKTNFCKFITAGTKLSQLAAAGEYFIFQLSWRT